MFEKISNLIEQYDSVVIFGHHHPDGDCYGSQIGLRELLKKHYPNKKVYAVGSGLPDMFSLIGEMDKVSEEVIKESLAIIVDANDVSRMEDMRITKAKAFCKIDHHMDLKTFTEGPEVIDDKADSACMLVLDFAKENNFEITPNIANALFLGTLTDTNRFQYSNNYEKLFSSCEYLISKGANPRNIYKILNMKEEAYLKFAGYVYSHYQKTNGGTLYLVFDRKALKEVGDRDAIEVANQVGLISNVKGYKIWVVFVERKDGRLSAEFRSNDLDVQAIASSHGGGGHLHAAGMTVAKFDKEFIKQVLDECDAAIKKGSK